MPQKPVKLARQKCVPCEGNEIPMTDEEIGNALRAHSAEIPGWHIYTTSSNTPGIRKIFFFRTYTDCGRFVGMVSEAADRYGHHPALRVDYRKPSEKDEVMPAVEVGYWTRAIRGVHDNDFRMAAKTEEIYRKFFH